MQERFLNSSLALCLGFVLFYTFLAYLKGPENKKTRNLLKAEAIQCLKQRHNKLQGCRDQNYSGEVSQFKFKSLSLICAVLHRCSITERSSKQTKTRNLLKAEAIRFIKKRCNKIQGFGNQNYSGEVSQFNFRSLSLICAHLHVCSISGRSSKQKQLEIY